VRSHLHSKIENFYLEKNSCKILILSNILLKIRKTREYSYQELIYSYQELILLKIAYIPLTKNIDMLKTGKTLAIF
jgi:hypothetical protein